MTAVDENVVRVAERTWWPIPVSWAWLAIVYFLAGAPAVFFSGITGLLVCALAIWEAGRETRANLTKGNKS